MAALEQFIPEIWSGAILETLQRALVFGAVANRNYEGEISQYGDVVKINQIGPITVSSYTPDSSSLTYATLKDAQTELKINQRKSIAFKVDDVINAQTKPKVMAAAMKDAAYRLRDNSDAYIAGLYADALITAGLGTEATPIDVTSVNVTEYMGLVSQKMSENNVPDDGRWFVGQPWFIQKLVLARITLDTSNSVYISQGFRGQYLGFDIFESNNVSVGTPASNAKTRNLAGYSQSITFAEQLVKMRAMELEDSFHTGVSGLYVYGAKYVRPETIACLRADYTVEP